MPRAKRDQIFISYSHKDTSWLKRLQTHLYPLIQKDSIALWDDTRLKPGSNWREEIYRALLRTRVAILLVSPDFLASEFITNHELPILFESASNGDIRILWIPVRDSLYKETAIERYQAAHDPSEPLASYKRYEQDSALVEICTRIKAALLSKHDGLNRNKRRTAIPKEELDSVKKIPSCPYRGLFAFGEKDAGLFFGREHFKGQMLKALGKRDLLAILGASGSGKSSIVFAGLVPQLRKEGGWLIVPFRPIDNPFYNLAAALLPIIEPHLSHTRQLIEAEELASALREGKLSLPSILLNSCAKQSARRLMLIIDQFEELYTLCASGEQVHFLDSILALQKPQGAQGKLKVLITLRADFLGQALSYSPLVDALQNADLKLGPMSEEQLRDVIEKPARKVGVSIEAGLTNRIIDAVSRAAGSLPLLEFALSSLWNLQSNRMLTHSAYDEIGGTERALANHAEAVYDRLDEAEKRIAADVFLQLVNPGEGTDDTRRRAVRSELGDSRWQLVSRFADEDSRLVVTNRNDLTGEETAELIHEALISEWTRLQEWMKSNREFRVWQERMRSMLRQWEEHGRSEEAVLSGILLTDSERWLGIRPDEISPVEKEFIIVSLQARLESQAIRESTALATLGLMATTVQHELKNIAFSAATLLETVIDKTSSDDSRFPYLMDCRRALSRVSSLALRMGTTGTTDRKSLSVPINLVHFIHEIVDLANKVRSKEPVNITVETTSKEIIIRGIEDELQQVFLNLIFNSFDAMKGRGGAIDLLVGAHNGRAIVRVRDNGPGISREDAAHVFDPLFTTKENGTGLGLYIAAQIVRAYGGDLHLEQSPEVGACFIVDLPLHIREGSTLATGGR